MPDDTSPGLCVFCDGKPSTATHVFPFPEIRRKVTEVSLEKTCLGHIRKACETRISASSSLDIFSFDAPDSPPDIYICCRPCYKALKRIETSWRPDSENRACKLVSTLFDENPGISNPLEFVNAVIDRAIPSEFCSPHIALKFYQDVAFPLLRPFILRNIQNSVRASKKLRKKPVSEALTKDPTDWENVILFSRNKRKNESFTKLRWSIHNLNLAQFFEIIEIGKLPGWTDYLRDKRLPSVSGNVSNAKVIVPKVIMSSLSSFGLYRFTSIVFELYRESRNFKFNDDTSFHRKPTSMIRQFLRSDVVKKIDDIISDVADSYNAGKDFDMDILQINFLKSIVACLREKGSDADRAAFRYWFGQIKMSVFGALFHRKKTVLRQIPFQLSTLSFENVPDLYERVKEVYNVIGDSDEGISSALGCCRFFVILLEQIGSAGKKKRDLACQQLRASLLHSQTKEDILKFLKSISLCASRTTAYRVRKKIAKRMNIQERCISKLLRKDIAAVQFWIDNLTLRITRSRFPSLDTNSSVYNFTGFGVGSVCIPQTLEDSEEIASIGSKVLEVAFSEDNPNNEYTDIFRSSFSDRAEVRDDVKSGKIILTTSSELSLLNDVSRSCGYLSASPSMDYSVSESDLYRFKHSTPEPKNLDCSFNLLSLSMKDASRLEGVEEGNRLAQEFLQNIDSRRSDSDLHNLVVIETGDAIIMENMRKLGETTREVVDVEGMPHRTLSYFLVIGGLHFQHALCAATLHSIEQSKIGQLLCGEWDSKDFQSTCPLYSGKGKDFRDTRIRCFTLHSALLRILNDIYATDRQNVLPNLRHFCRSLSHGPNSSSNISGIDGEEDSTSTTSNDEESDDDSDSIDGFSLSALNSSSREHSTSRDGRSLGSSTSSRFLTENSSSDSDESDFPDDESSSSISSSCEYDDDDDVSSESSSDSDVEDDASLPLLPFSTNRARLDSSLSHTSVSEPPPRESLHPLLANRRRTGRRKHAISSKRNVGNDEFWANRNEFLSQCSVENTDDPYLSVLQVVDLMREEELANPGSEVYLFLEAVYIGFICRSFRVSEKTGCVSLLIATLKTSLLIFLEFKCHRYATLVQNMLRDILTQLNKESIGFITKHALHLGVDSSRSWFQSIDGIGEQTFKEVKKLPLGSEQQITNAAKMVELNNLFRISSSSNDKFHFLVDDTCCFLDGSMLFDRFHSKYISQEPLSEGTQLLYVSSDALAERSPFRSKYRHPRKVFSFSSAIRKAAEKEARFHCALRIPLLDSRDPSQGSFSSTPSRKNGSRQDIGASRCIVAMLRSSGDSLPRSLSYSRLSDEGRLVNPRSGNSYGIIDVLSLLESIDPTSPSSSAVPRGKPILSPFRSFLDAFRSEESHSSQTHIVVNASSILRHLLSCTQFEEYQIVSSVNDATNLESSDRDCNILTVERAAIHILLCCYGHDFDILSVCFDCIRNLNEVPDDSDDSLRPDRSSGESFVNMSTSPLRDWSAAKEDSRCMSRLISVIVSCIQSVLENGVLQSAKTPGFSRLSGLTLFPCGQHPPERRVFIRNEDHSPSSQQFLVNASYQCIAESGEDSCVNSISTLREWMSDRNMLFDKKLNHIVYNSCPSIFTSAFLFLCDRERTASFSGESPSEFLHLVFHSRDRKNDLMHADMHKATRAILEAFRLENIESFLFLCSLLGSKYFSALAIFSDSAIHHKHFFKLLKDDAFLQQKLKAIASLDTSTKSFEIDSDAVFCFFTFLLLLRRRTSRSDSSSSEIDQSWRKFFQKLEISSPGSHISLSEMESKYREHVRKQLDYPTDDFRIFSALYGELSSLFRRSRTEDSSMEDDFRVMHSPSKQEIEHQKNLIGRVMNEQLLQIFFPLIHPMSLDNILSQSCESRIRLWSSTYVYHVNDSTYGMKQKEAYGMAAGGKHHRDDEPDDSGVPEKRSKYSPNIDHVEESIS